MAAPINQADLERVIGPATLGRLFSHDGSGQVNPQLLDDNLQAGLDDVRGILMAGWPEAVIDELIQADRGIWKQTCRYIIALRAQDDITLINPTTGKHPMSGWLQDAERYLTKRAEAKGTRSPAEDIVGENRRARVHGRPVGRPRKWGGNSSSPYGQGGF